MNTLTWKDEKAMIKQDVELHLAWHKRTYEWSPAIREMTIKEWAKELLQGRKSSYYLTIQTPQWDHSQNWNKIRFGYNGCQFNVYDNPKSLALFYAGLSKRI